MTPHRLVSALAIHRYPRDLADSANNGGHRDLLSVHLQSGHKADGRLVRTHRGWPNGRPAIRWLNIDLNKPRTARRARKLPAGKT